MKSLIVNIFGGPGVGKSTFAASIFTRLKQDGASVELVTEFAKDLTWSSRQECLKCQPYVFGEQLYRLERLNGKVDVIVTDSPILLSAIYSNRYPESFTQSVLDIFTSLRNLNVLLRRKYAYTVNGRNESPEEAAIIDSVILNKLRQYNIPFNIPSDSSNINPVMNNIYKELRNET